MKPYIPMIDDSQVLQAAVTKTADFDGAFLDLGQNFEPQGLGQTLAAVVPVTALDLSSGNETYAFKISQAPDDGTGVADTANITDASPSVSVTATGVVVVPAIVQHRFIRLSLDTGGTTPSIAYSANLGR